MLMDTLSLIASELNKEKITWAIGASMMLHHYGLEEEPRDIDILVTLQDIHKALAVLDRLGLRTPASPKGKYTTAHFHEYVINGTDVDVMAGFGIRLESGAFTYDFNQKAIVDHMTLDHVKVPLTSLEDWYVLYQLISGREARTAAIESYLTANGVQHPDRLQTALSWNIPGCIRDRAGQLRT